MQYKSNEIEFPEQKMHVRLTQKIGNKNTFELWEFPEWPYPFRVRMKTSNSSEYIGAFKSYALAIGMLRSMFKGAF